MSEQPGLFAIVVGRFYEELAGRLIAGASAAYEQAGASFEAFEVPGAFSCRSRPPTPPPAGALKGLPAWAR